MLPYGRQTITDDDIRAVVDVLQSPLLTCGAPSHVPRACSNRGTSGPHVSRGARSASTTAAMSVSSIVWRP